MNGQQQQNIHFNAPQQTLSARLPHGSSNSIHLNNNNSNTSGHHQQQSQQQQAQRQYLIQQNYIETFTSAPNSTIQQQQSITTSQQLSPNNSGEHQTPHVYRAVANQTFSHKDSIQKELQTETNKQQQTNNSENVLISPDVFIQMQNHYENQIRTLQNELSSMRSLIATNLNNSLSINAATTKASNAKTNRNNHHIVETYCENIQVKEFICKNCVYKTKSEASLIIHNTNHLVNQRYLHLPTTVFTVKPNDATNSFLYPCGECNGGKFTNNDLYLHIYQNHTGEHPFHCNECDLFFMHYDFLDDHQRSQHMKSTSKKKIRLENSIQTQLSYYSVVKCSKPFSALSSSLGTSNATSCPVHRSGTNSSTNNTSNSSWNSSQQANNAQQMKSITNSSVNFSFSVKRGRGRGCHHGSRATTFSTTSTTAAAIAPSTSSSPNSIHSNSDSISDNGIIQYKCHYEDCFFEADTKDRLDFHLYAHQNSRFKCPHCPYVSNVLNDIKRHCVKGQKHVGSMFTCRNCEFQTNCDKTFRDHIRTIHFGKNIDDKTLTIYIEELFRNTPPPQRST